MASSTADSFLTLGQIPARVRELGGPRVTTSQVKYAVDQYRIAPVARIGILRVWSEDSLPLIKSALERIAANRGGRL
jgi:hypothetical protein